MISKFEMEVGGRPLTFETGRLAAQANGAVTVRYGETILLVTATAGSVRTGIDFLPLTIDVEEKMYAAGKIPGGFFRREGRPSTDGILMCRLVDRPVRPLFPKDIHNDLQIVATILSSDQVHPPDVLAILGASAALAISDIPWDGPIGGSRIGLFEGELVVNPTYEEIPNSDLDLVVSGTGDAIMMVEAGARELTETVLVDALRLAQEVNGAIVDLISEMQAKIGKPKWTVEPDLIAQSSRSAALEWIGDSVKMALAKPGDKQSRQDALSAVHTKLVEALGGDHDPVHLKSAFYKAESDAVREAILQNGQRPDGRSAEQIRPLTSEVGLLPRVHGSGLFTRGETQILSAVALASLGDHQRIDTLSPVDKKYFLHHYNFPPYSTGETGRMFTGRREIGHGALAERALAAVIPDQADFPYTVRVVSEALSSNGSTSMASVCASTLALMDAGVPIKAPVAGIAMGLMTGENGEAAILTDIQGAEDHTGDMDFKVAGTVDGVTALQMDIKIKGLSFEIMEKALDQARDARLKIIDHIKETLAGPREEMSPYAPRMISMTIPVDKIGAVIGPGGKVIRGMISEFDVSIDVSDDGTVMIGSSDQEGANKAQAQIAAMTKDVEVGDRYTGKVVRIMPFGAFVNLLPGKDGLVHISELSEDRVPSVESVVELGDELEVLVINVDRMGRVDLSVRALQEADGGASRLSDGSDGNRDRPETRGPRRPSSGDRGGRRHTGGYSGDGGGGGRRPPRRG